MLLFFYGKNSACGGFVTIAPQHSRQNFIDPLSQQIQQTDARLHTVTKNTRPINLCTRSVMLGPKYTICCFTRPKKPVG